MKYLLENQESERLSFHLLEDKYFDEWLTLFKAKNVAKFLGLDQSKSPKELCELWFEKVSKRYETNRGSINVLIDKQSGQFIGQSGLLVQEIEGEKRLEVAYSILPKYWEKGYASEAAQKCKEYAFQKKISDSLISIVHIENFGSAQVARKNGMLIEKRIENYQGSPVDIFCIHK